MISFHTSLSPLQVRVGVTFHTLAILSSTQTDISNVHIHSYPIPEPSYGSYISFEAVDCVLVDESSFNPLFDSKRDSQTSTRVVRSRNPIHAWLQLSLTYLKLLTSISVPNNK
jgi:hypothetical protein